jgi:hypothetical protein
VCERLLGITTRSRSRLAGGPKKSLFPALSGPALFATLDSDQPMGHRRDTPIHGRDAPIHGRDAPIHGRDAPMHGRDVPMGGNDVPMAWK